MRLEDIAERLGDQIDAIRSSLDGQEDVAVVDARDAHGGSDALLIATRAGILVTYPWSGRCGQRDGHDRRLGRMGRRSRLDRADGAPSPRAHHPRASQPRCRLDRDHGPADATRAPSCCGASELMAQGDGDQGRRAVDAFHDEVVRRGTPWHYPS